MNKKNSESKEYYFTIEGKKYAFNLEVIKQILGESKDTEKEITETYEKDEKGVLDISAKILREYKTNGNSQNDMVVYDIAKLLIVRLLENDTLVNDEFEMDFSTSLALNTLISWGIIIEVE